MYPEPVSLLHGYPETTLAGLARVHSYVSHNNVDLGRPTAGGRRIKEASKNTASKKKPQEPCLDNRLSFAHQFGFMKGKKSIPYQFQPSFGAISGAARKHPPGPGWALPHGQGNLPRGRSIRGRPGPGCLGGGCPEGGFPGQGVAPSGGGCPEGGFLGQRVGSNHGPRGEAQLGPN